MDQKAINCSHKSLSLMSDKSIKSEVNGEWSYKMRYEWQKKREGKIISDDIGIWNTSMFSTAIPAPVKEDNPLPNSWNGNVTNYLFLKKYIR